MEKIVGYKESFAIEFEISDAMQFMGYAKLWLQGSPLGAEKDLIYFETYLFDLLDQFCYAKKIEKKFIKDSIHQTFSVLKKYTFDITDKEYNASIYSCSGATFTDDFFVFSYLDNDFINILWKPRKNAYFQEVKALGSRLFHFRMESEKFCQLTNEYKNYIKQLVNVK